MMTPNPVSMPILASRVIRELLAVLSGCRTVHGWPPNKFDRSQFRTPRPRIPVRLFVAGLQWLFRENLAQPVVFPLAGGLFNQPILAGVKTQKCRMAIRIHH